jgi:aspartate/methionine/tyrosine aminotransferase
VRPGGAFYAFPNITGTGYASRQLQDALLSEVGVALVSGTSFGDQGEGYIRFSYASSIANIEEAIDRIGRFLGR